MKVLVAVKAVPLLDGMRFQSGINRVVREEEAMIVNPPDEHAVVVAVGLRAGEDDEVVAVTMGPPEIDPVVQGLLDHGVDRLIHLCDPMFAGADTLATARALAAVFRREQADLLVCGRGTIDGGTAQTPAQVAELLGVPYASGVVDVDLSPDAAWVVREVERASEERRLQLPAVVSVEPHAARSAAGATAAGAVPTRARRATLEVLDAEQLGGDGAGYGIRGSRTYVQRVEELPYHRTTQAATCAEAVEVVEDAYRSACAGVTDFLPRSTLRPPSPARHELWTVAERDGGRLHPVSFEAIACAAQVAERLEADIVAVLLCDQPGLQAYELAARGADRVLAVCSPDLAGNDPDATVTALARVLADRQPLAVIAPWSSAGREVLPRVAAQLELGLTGDFVGLDVAARPGDAKVLDLVWLKPAWAGTALARVVARSAPSLGTLRPGAVRRLPVRDATRVPVETVTLDAAGRGRNELLATSPFGAGSGDPVDTALVVLCVGRRVSGATVAKLERLTRGLPWAVAGTAGAVADGLVPAQRELSAIKRSIAPPVFVGIELDGPDDLICVRSAGVIVTVGEEPAGHLYGLVDATVAAAPDAFVEELVAALAGPSEVGSTA